MYGVTSGAEAGGGYMPAAVGGQQSPGMWSQVGTYLQQNPEMLSIVADMIGSGVWSREEGNPFAGVGTMLGQSSLANKAYQNRIKEQEQWKGIIGKLLSGGNIEGNQNLSPENTLTPKGMNGGDSLNIQTNPDGSGIITRKSTVNAQGPNATMYDIFQSPDF